MSGSSVAPSEPPAPRRVAWAAGHRIALVALAAAVALAFALYTSAVWEDSLLSFRHSVHLAEGAGLTYQEGERTQGFSSPLATLLLFATYALTGFSSHAGALWLFRLLSIGAFASGMWLFLRILDARGPARGWLPAAPVLIYLLDAKAVSFSVNGMETGFLLCFAMGALACLACGVDRAAWALGGFWAGMMWTRPDSVVYIGAMALAALLFSDGRGRTAAALGRAGALCTAGYLPWVLWAWRYYGSPIPLPVVAKATNAGILSAAGLARGVSRIPVVWSTMYLPPYAEYGGWPALRWASLALGMVASLYWLHPRGAPWGRRASLVTLAGVGYLALLPIAYPWYYPAAVAASLPASAAALSYLDAATWLSRRARSATLAAISVAVLLAQLRMTADHARFSRLMQSAVEDGQRREIGLWLRSQASPTDRVYLECPGYIGFYSGVEMLDYPGLVSPSVVAARLLVGDNFAAVGMRLAPEWMVLRPEEVAAFESREPGWLPRHYESVRTFDVSDRLREGGERHSAILYDATFQVLRRR